MELRSESGALLHKRTMSLAGQRVCESRTGCPNSSFGAAEVQTPWLPYPGKRESTSAAELLVATLVL